MSSLQVWFFSTRILLTNLPIIKYEVLWIEEKWNITTCFQLGSWSNHTSFVHPQSQPECTQIQKSKWNVVEQNENLYDLYPKNWCINVVYLTAIAVRIVVQSSQCTSHQHRRMTETLFDLEKKYYSVWHQTCRNSSCYSTCYADCSSFL